MQIVKEIIMRFENIKIIKNVEPIPEDEFTDKVNWSKGYGEASIYKKTLWKRIKQYFKKYK